MEEGGKYVGKFSAQFHFFGYEGRCAAPSNYDADYCYSLGFNASCLIANGKTGYMSVYQEHNSSGSQWIAGGVPITMMMNIERRHGANKPVIRKALVELDGAPFKFFASKREQWAKETAVCISRSYPSTGVHLRFATIRQDLSSLEQAEVIRIVISIFICQQDERLLHRKRRPWREGRLPRRGGSGGRRRLSSVFARYPRLGMVDRWNGG